MDMSSNNLVHAVDELVNRGYDHDLRLIDGTLFDVTTNANLGVEEIMVDAAIRFEPAPGSDDPSNLYAISTQSGMAKGLLIDAFDLLNRQAIDPLRERLEAQRIVSAYDGSECLATKFGLPKVFKSEFNEDPDRYVLRKGFPDFPDCPYGESYSMLGYDTHAKHYVWLVTSILKDKRLRTEIYPAVKQSGHSAVSNRIGRGAPIPRID
jgi:hypothetical protein